MYIYLLTIYPDCRPYGEDPTESPIQMYCNDGEYNVIGAIWFQTPEQSVRYDDVTLFYGIYSYTIEKII